MKRNKHPEFSPFYACFLPRLKEAANKHGYALAYHGSMATDLDLLCVPWVDEPSTPEVLIQEMSKVLRIETIDGDPEVKPHGRLAWCLPICANAVFDVSVMPVQKTVEQVTRIIINKEMMPAVCEDSGQAEWSTGEAQKLAEAICSRETVGE